MVKPRERLLQAVMKELAGNGLRDRSLRDVAAAVGTSHRMLIHHFGSKEGLWTAVVRCVEEAQRESMAEFGTRHAGEAMIEMWNRLSRPGYWPHERRADSL